jgi:hypothetical protein
MRIEGEGRSMNEVHTPPPPNLQSEPIASADREVERRAFLRLLPTLLPTHRGQYVAVYHQGVVAAGPDQVDVAKTAYSQAGYVPIYVGLVTDERAQPVRLPSLRLLPDGGTW